MFPFLFWEKLGNRIGSVPENIFNKSIVWLASKRVRYIALLLYRDIFFQNDYILTTPPDLASCTIYIHPKEKKQNHCDKIEKLKTLQMVHYKLCKLSRKLCTYYAANITFGIFNTSLGILSSLHRCCSTGIEVWVLFDILKWIALNIATIYWIVCPFDHLQKEVGNVAIFFGVTQ